MTFQSENRQFPFHFSQADKASVFLRQGHMACLPQMPRFFRAPNGSASFKQLIVLRQYPSECVAPLLIA
jgi:hypothetical protein